MIQQRLAHSIDQHLQPQQYGFRANRSFSTALFLLRCLTEIFERVSPLLVQAIMPLFVTANSSFLTLLLLSLLSPCPRYPSRVLTQSLPLHYCLLRFDIRSPLLFWGHVLLHPLDVLIVASAYGCVICWWHSSHRPHQRNPFSPSPPPSAPSRSHRPSSWWFQMPTPHHPCRIHAMPPFQSLSLSLPPSLPPRPCWLHL